MKSLYWGAMKDITGAIALSVIIRAALFFYGVWQDNNLNVKFTDVDYYVFSDAARFVWNGQSPFNRDTYRYTPILSFLLLPNEIVGQSFGKLLFMAADILCGLLMYYNLCKYFSPRKSTLLSCLWLLNPMVFTISTRGNAESLLCFFILLTFHLVSSNRISLAAIVFGFTVHFKIFPVIYSITFISYFYRKCNGSFMTRLFSGQLIKFGLLSAFVFFFLTGLMYHIYGYECLYESLLYHLVRKDHRHNFSLYFYSIYLEMFSNSTSLLSMFAFVPQFLSVIAVGLCFGFDLYFAAFLQTFLFVAYNKVCTSQYFLWFICLLPFIVPRISMKIASCASLIVLWFLSQGIWLFFAYKLEFLGENTFLPLWMAGILFFLVNIVIASTLIVSYAPVLKNE